MKNSNNGDGKKPDSKWWEQVPPIVPGQVAFSKKQTRLLLGGISDSYYYELCAKGLLKTSRMKPGGKTCHTQQQLDEYDSYLNLDAVVDKGSRLTLQKRRLG